VELGQGLYIINIKHLRQN